MSKARAPYNFVSQPNERQHAYVKQFQSRFDQFKGYSGVIELEIETLTPTLVGDIQEDGKVVQNFSLNGSPVLPGSSIRGMIRNIFEIVTYSELSLIDKKRQLYFRSVADKKHLKFLEQQYKKEKLANAKVGIIHKKNNTFYIRPVVLENGLDGVVDKLPEQKAETELKNNQFDYTLENGRIIWTSGYIQGKRTKYQLPLEKIPLSDKEDAEIPEDLLKSFRKDVEKFGGELRNEFHVRKALAVDLLDQRYYLDIPINDDNTSSRLKGLPVFYTQNNGKISHFGHTKFSRRPYKNAIGDIAVKSEPEKRPEKKTDLARRVFGDTENLASRLSFTDAHLAHQQDEDVFEEEVRLKPLLNPKPTSFQLYLRQEKDKFANISYDSNDAMLRGFKLYFHRPYINQKKGWNAIQSQNAKDTVAKTMRPIRSGIRFQSKIHYMNLTKIELGALLFTLNLPEDCAHKIGMGKPYGLGSIKITFTNNLKMKSINNNKYPLRLTKVFKKGQMYNNNLKFKDEKAVDSFKLKMRELTKPYEWKTNTPKYNWTDNGRLKSLKHLLTYINRDSFDWFCLTEYMGKSQNGKIVESSMEPYRDRISLPDALDVGL